MILRQFVGNLAMIDEQMDIGMFFSSFVALAAPPFLATTLLEYILRLRLAQTFSIDRSCRMFGGLVVDGTTVHLLQ